MFESAVSVFADRALPVHGMWTYRRGPLGQLVEIAPDTCPNGHQLGPWKVTLPWNPGLRDTTICCNACYQTDPATATFQAARPAFMLRFDELMAAGRKRDAMAVLDEATLSDRGRAAADHRPVHHADRWAAADAQGDRRTR